MRLLPLPLLFVEARLLYFSGLQSWEANAILPKFIGMTGFEPATPSSRTKCATKLRYIPLMGFFNRPPRLK